MHREGESTQELKRHLVLSLSGPIEVRQPLQQQERGLGAWFRNNQVVISAVVAIAGSAIGFYSGLELFDRQAERSQDERLAVSRDEIDAVAARVEGYSVLIRDSATGMLAAWDKRNEILEQNSSEGRKEAYTKALGDLKSEYGKLIPNLAQDGRKLADWAWDMTADNNSIIRPTLISALTSLDSLVVQLEQLPLQLEIVARRVSVLPNLDPEKLFRLQMVILKNNAVLVACQMGDTHRMYMSFQVGAEEFQWEPLYTSEQCDAMIEEAVALIDQSPEYTELLQIMEPGTNAKSSLP